MRDETRQAMGVEWNIEARLCSDYSRGNAVNIKYYDCVTVLKP